MALRGAPDSAALVFSASTAEGWIAVVAVFALLLLAAYFAFGPAALGLPTWIAILAALAALSVPGPLGTRVIAALVGGLIVLLVIGFAMRLRSQPPGSSEPPEKSTAPPSEPRE